MFHHIKGRCKCMLRMNFFVRMKLRMTQYIIILIVDTEKNNSNRCIIMFDFDRSILLLLLLKVGLSQRVFLYVLEGKVGCHGRQKREISITSGAPFCFVCLFF